MTSVPKPLKFLRPHYAALKAVYDGMVSKSSAGGAGGEENRKALADIMSILAMTMAAPGTRDRLVTFFSIIFHTSYTVSVGCISLRITCAVWCC
jgi:RPN1 N-terminal domain